MTKKQKRREYEARVSARQMQKFADAFPRRSYKPDGSEMIPWGCPGWEDAPFEEEIRFHTEVFISK